MDTLEITILEDGTIKTETSPISPANHQNAEDFMRDMAVLAGGAVTRAKRPGAHVHTHHGHHVEQK
jgi:hypothetical protein